MDDNTVTTANITLKETFLERLITQSRLKVVNTIKGFWRNDVDKQSLNDFQDILVLKA